MEKMNTVNDIWKNVTSRIEEGMEAIAEGNTYIARDIFEEEAKRGDPEAMYKLGIICRDGGRGVVADREEARRWFSRASEAGHQRAHGALLAMNSYSEYITVFTEKGYGGNFGGEMSRFRR